MRLVRPALEHKNKYREMISEWQQYGGPYVPCIVEYDCSNPIQELDYEAVLKVVDDYRNGKIFDYDVDYFERADFYFVFDSEELVGICEIIHDLKPLGNKEVGNVVYGIRPSMRNQGYALKTLESMIDKLKEDGANEVIFCHNTEHSVDLRTLETLGFAYRDSITSLKNKKKIKCYIKKLK